MRLLTKPHVYPRFVSTIKQSSSGEELYKDMLYNYIGYSVWCKVRVKLTILRTAKREIAHAIKPRRSSFDIQWEIEL
jgi:hypothetical protein